MNNPTVIWRFGEPMEKSYKGESRKYMGAEALLKHGEYSRSSNFTDSYKNRDTVNTTNNDFGCVTSNPFFERKPISDVISNQEEFMRGRQNNSSYKL